MNTSRRVACEGNETITMLPSSRPHTHTHTADIEEREREREQALLLGYRVRLFKAELRKGTKRERTPPPPFNYTNGFWVMFWNGTDQWKQSDIRLHFKYIYIYIKAELNIYYYSYSYSPVKKPERFTLKQLFLPPANSSSLVWPLNPAVQLNQGFKKIQIKEISLFHQKAFVNLHYGAVPRDGQEKGQRSLDAPVEWNEHL